MNNNEIRTIPISTVSNVIAGGTVTISLPTNDTYQKVFLETNIPYSLMTNVLLKVEDNQTWEFKDMQALNDTLNKYPTLATSTGILQIPFILDFLNQRNERVITALGTLDLNKVTIEFKIDASVSNPIIDVTAEVTNNTNSGLMLHVKNTHADYATTGIKTITENEIPKGYGINTSQGKVYPRLLAVHFKNDDISSFELKTGNTSVHKVTRKLLNHQLKATRPFPRTQLAGQTHIDFLRNGTLAGSFNMVYKNITFIVDIETAGSYDFQTVYLAPHRGV